MAFPICHLSFARQNLNIVKDQLIGDFLGYYYYGATFADANVISRQTNQSRLRDKFHFLYPYSLQPDDLFFAFKQLYTGKNWDFSNPVHRAFYLGYVCHLLTDAIYNYFIFQNYFNKQSIFSGSVLHHDVFRFYLDCQYTDIIQNKSIASQISLIDTTKLTQFYPNYIHLIWKGVISRQIMFMPDTDKIFHNFVGDKSRFQADLDNYNALIDSVRLAVNPADINKFKKNTIKLLKLAKSELFNPHSVYTIEDLDKINI